MADRPAGAVIEIIERRTEPSNPDHAAADTIVPNEIRLNGQALLTPTGHPVTVHEIALRERDLVLVTLTLFAKRVVIGVEEPQEEVTGRG
ncbi:hypothetical protein ABZ671_00870 [Micromonospora sp. NPDC006766]|uniref:hypothetical protein n=1 Tax=Micromonospora sp. NPDC006766 TaxID=3154778 RepID=UPI00340B255D